VVEWTRGTTCETIRLQILIHSTDTLAILLQPTLLSALLCSDALLSLQVFHLTNSHTLPTLQNLIHWTPALTTLK
jgi:hypothetical protein